MPIGPRTVGSLALLLMLVAVVGFGWLDLHWLTYNVRHMPIPGRPAAPPLYPPWFAGVQLAVIFGLAGVVRATR